PPPHRINDLMKELLFWIKKNEGKVHPLIMSAVFHYEFVFIHPFSDGNGRMARLWHTVILYRWRSIFAYIPLESQIEKFQDDYYDAIAQCHVNGNSDIFIEFMLEKIDQALDDVILQVNKSNAGTSEYVKRLLECMEYDVPYTANAIMERLGLKSKETLRKNYLKPAMELGLVNMTLSDKPNSRNQRYVKQ
ncbi:MAG: Fic family protein, partial [Acetivibrio ethanolgignens]